MSLPTAANVYEFHQNASKDMLVLQTKSIQENILRIKEPC